MNYNSVRTKGRFALRSDSQAPVSPGILLNQRVFEFGHVLSIPSFRGGSETRIGVIMHKLGPLAPLPLFYYLLLQRYFRKFSLPSYYSAALKKTFRRLSRTAFPSPSSLLSPLFEHRPEQTPRADKDVGDSRFGQTLFCGLGLACSSNAAFCASYSPFSPRVDIISELSAPETAEHRFF